MVLSQEWITINININHIYINNVESKNVQDKQIM